MMSVKMNYLLLVFRPLSADGVIAYLCATQAELQYVCHSGEDE